MRNLYFLIACLLTFQSYSQISIDKFSMPSKGETLKTWGSLTTNVDLGVEGGPQTWDFSNLTKDVENNITLLDPSEGTVEVSNASFLIMNGEFVERYFNKADDAITEIYLKTLDPIFETFEISNEYAEAPVYRKATILYGQDHSNTSIYRAAIAWSDLPDTITGQVGLAIDSIRINTNFERTDDIDAYGTVMLPDGEWEALRESSRNIRSVTIDIFFLGVWIEAPAEILETALGGFADLLAPDTTYTTNFYTNQAIEVLATFNLDDNGDPVTAEFKEGSEITDLSILESKSPDVQTFPNPSFGNVTFNFENCTTGKYTIQVFNILGKKLWMQDVTIDSSKSIRVDLTTLKKGTYLYSVYDKNGNKITTKRLVILNP
jgi:hypothetical protein